MTELELNICILVYAVVLLIMFFVVIYHDVKLATRPDDMWIDALDGTCCLWIILWPLALVCLLGLCGVILIIGALCSPGILVKRSIMRIRK